MMIAGKSRCARSFTVLPCLILLVHLQGTSLNAQEVFSAGRSVSNDSASVAARRKQSLDDLKSILGNTSSAASQARYGPPFLLGYLSSFLGLQTRGRIT